MNYRMVFGITSLDHRNFSFFTSFTCRRIFQTILFDAVAFSTLKSCWPGSSQWFHIYWSGWCIPILLRSKRNVRLMHLSSHILGRVLKAFAAFCVSFYACHFYWYKIMSSIQILNAYPVSLESRLRILRTRSQCYSVYIDHKTGHKAEIFMLWKFGVQAAHTSQDDEHLSKS